MLALHEIDGLAADEALQAVVTRVARRMVTEVATLYAYDPDRERLVLAATHGLARSAIGFVTLALGEGISGEAALRRSPVAAADVGRDPQFKIIPGFDQSRYRSILAVPVSHRGELLGVLNVQTVAPREYGPADRDLLCRLADEVARHLARTGRDGHLALRLRGPTLLSTLSGMVAASGGRTEVCVRVLAELAVVLPEADTAIALSPGRHDAEPVLIAPDGGSDVHPDLAAALHGGPPAAEDAMPADPDEAIAFYCDGLGLEVRKDVAADGFRWVTIGAPGQEDLDVVLFQPQGGMAPQDADALLTLVTKGALQSAIFRTDDLDATFERLQAGDGEVVQEPTEQPYGVRDCAVRDPAGNLLRIQELR